jgi:hypothetical protein
MIRARRISPHFSRLALTTALLAAVSAGGARAALEPERALSRQVPFPPADLIARTRRTRRGALQRE